MRNNRLGRTGLFVSELCLGTMTFGQSKGRYAAASGVDQDTVDAILRALSDQRGRQGRGLIAGADAPPLTRPAAIAVPPVQLVP